MKRCELIENLKVGLDEDLEIKLSASIGEWGEYRVLKKSVDARKRHAPHFVYTIEWSKKGEWLPEREFLLAKVKKIRDEKPIIVGTGPAGLFCALRLAERGIPSRIFERGGPAHERIKGINRYWRYGEMDSNNNVCFGEGGAGLYSDGKLITRIKSPHIEYVLKKLVDFGAPQEILYLANPHVGSDRIRRLIPVIREFLISKGCEFHFYTCVQELLYEKGSSLNRGVSDTQAFNKTSVLNKPYANELGDSLDAIDSGIKDANQKRAASLPRVIGVKTQKGEDFYSPWVVLATGHSAEDILYHLLKAGVQVSAKDFAMGLRVEHPQSLINQIQYGKFFEHPSLGAANYRLTYNKKIKFGKRGDGSSEDSSSKESSYDEKSFHMGVYSFCMCPGGFVLSSGTETDRLVSNGMSNYNRGSRFANSAIVVSIDSEYLQRAQKTLGLTARDSKLLGMQLRESIERRAFESVTERQGGHRLAAQKLKDFMVGKKGSEGSLSGSCPSGAQAVNFHEILPAFMTEGLLEGLASFDKKMPGFISSSPALNEAILYGVESRTSCPLRVDRHPVSYESLSHLGLFPAGEGAGYAGGITSSAVDGVEIAERIFQQYE